MSGLGQQKPIFPRWQKRAIAPFCLQLGEKEEGKEEYNCPVVCIALVWDVWDQLLLSLISVVVFFARKGGDGWGERRRSFAFFASNFV